MRAIISWSKQQKLPTFGELNVGDLFYLPNEFHMIENLGEEADVNKLRMKTTPYRDMNAVFVLQGTWSSIHPDTEVVKVEGELNLTLPVFHSPV